MENVKMIKRESEIKELLEDKMVEFEFESDNYIENNMSEVCWDFDVEENNGENGTTYYSYYVDDTVVDVIYYLEDKLSSFIREIRDYDEITPKFSEDVVKLEDELLCFIYSLKEKIKYAIEEETFQMTF